MFENSAVQPGSADRLGIGWCVRGAYWLTRQPFVSLHQQAFNECWWLKVNVLGQTATTATKTVCYMGEMQIHSNSRNQHFVHSVSVHVRQHCDFHYKSPISWQMKRLVVMDFMSSIVKDCLSNFTDFRTLLVRSIKCLSKQTHDINSSFSSMYAYLSPIILLSNKVDYYWWWCSSSSWPTCAPTYILISYKVSDISGGGPCCGTVLWDMFLCSSH